MRQLHLRHLQREQGHGLAGLHRDVLGDVADDRGLAHRRPAGHHDQVSVLEAAGEGVQVPEARGGAGDAALAGGEGLELVDLVGEDGADLAEVGGLLLVGDLEQEALCLLDHLRGLAVAVGDRLLDRLGGGVQPAHQRVLLDDRRVVLGAAGSGDLGGEARDHVLAADLLQLAVLGELLGDREDVDRVRVLVQVDDRLEDRAVAVAVEVLGLEANVQQHRLDGGLSDHHRPQHRLLRLQVLRGNDAAGCFRVRQLPLSRAHARVRPRDDHPVSSRPRRRKLGPGGRVLRAGR